MGVQYIKQGGEWKAILGTSTNADVITSSMVVQIPTDYSTLQEAIDALSVRPIVQGATITLNIESGHEPTTGVSVQNGNFGHFIITSTDAEVTLGTGFEGVFMYASNAVAPTLGTIIDMDGLGTYAARIINNADFLMESNKGFKNSGGYGIYCQSSRVRGAFPVLTGMADRTIWATRGAVVSLPEGDLSGQTGGVYGVYASRASVVDITTAKVNNMNVSGSAIIALRSRIAFIQGQCNYSGATGLTASQGSHIGAQDTKVQFATGHGVVAQGASMIDFTNGDARYAGGHALYAVGASQIAADNVHAPNATGNSVRASGGSTISVVGGELRYATDTNKIYIERGSFVVAHGANTTAAGGLDTSNMNITTLNTIDGSKGVVWG